jgi:hypothetical protein
MTENKTFAEHILQFIEELSQQSFEFPASLASYRIINPYKGEQKALVEKIGTTFYQKYYHDRHACRLILGSSPARRSSAVTGIPFEDGKHIQDETGVFIDKSAISASNQASQDFLYDVMKEYGGRKKFYGNFYMNFVFPLGLVRTNSKGNEVNCNYYENKELQENLSPFMVNVLRRYRGFGIDTSVCYCIGSGENYKFLSKINGTYKFFDTIIALEHPRFIMQYNSKSKDIFMEKYMKALGGVL